MNFGKEKIKVNMTEIAKRAGVSQATVSRVVNQNPRVGDKNRNAVLKAMKDMNYQGQVLELLQNTPYNVLQFVLLMCRLPEQENVLAMTFFKDVIDGIREILAKDGHKLSIQLLSYDADFFESMDEWSGIFLLGYPSEKLCGNLRSRRIPHVIISGDIDSANSDIVSVNNFESGVLLAQYAISSGARNIGYLLYKENSIRGIGIEFGAREAGYPVRPGNIRFTEDTDNLSFMNSLRDWVKEKDFPDALVISYANAAEGCRTILELSGFRIPEDVRLFSYASDSDKKASIPVMLVRPLLMGKRAAEFILRKIEFPEEPPYKIIVPMLFSEQDESSCTTVK